jgi:hypothetical protein
MKGTKEGDRKEKNDVMGTNGGKGPLEESNMLIACQSEGIPWMRVEKGL